MPSNIIIRKAMVRYFIASWLYNLERYFINYTLKAYLNSSIQL